MGSACDFLIAPFVDYAFMRTALAAIFCVSLSSAPIGVFLVMRRMSLMGDALGHAILPGVAAAYLLVGLQPWAMGAGALAAGCVVALGSVAADRLTALREDATMTVFYLTSLALGVAMVSWGGVAVDLDGLLFGSLLAVDNESLLMVAVSSTLSICALALIYRPLAMESADPGFLKSVGGRGWLWHGVFQVTVILNLVAGFQTLGTLLSVGMMMLPAIAAKLWARSLEGTLALAIVFALISGYAGLLASYHADLPSGPSVILAASVLCLLSLPFGTSGGALRRR